MKKVLAALLFCLFPGSEGFPQHAGIAVVATPIPIDPSDPARVGFGRLRYLAGWHLTSRQSNFGGYSALTVEGDRFFALADTGDYLRFRLNSSGVIDEQSFGTLPALPAYSGARRDRDSEAMAIGPEGDIWIAFEGHNAILRYDPGLSRLHSMAWPPAMKDWAPNSGPEAMVRLEGGRFVVLAEGSKSASGLHPALLFPGDPTKARNAPFEFSYRPPDHYVPTDAALMPDGRIVVLNRHFGILDGVWAAVTVIDPTMITPDAVVEGELLGELKPPLNIDNMEGIAVVREGGRTILWMISDDNQLPVQRTLLLKFALDDR